MHINSLPTSSQATSPGRAPAHVDRHTDDYDYMVVGNPQDVVTPTRGGTALMGGGEDSDTAFRWMLDHSGGGDFVVLRATGTDAYNPYIRDLGEANSVATIVTKNRQAAYDPFILDQVRNAEAIFIAGGDQSEYVERWQGTPLHEVLNDAVARGVPIGGTSAGLAVLADRPFTATFGGVTSQETLSDPCRPEVTLGRHFLTIPHMRYTVTDTHFHERDRMGRLVSFVGNVAEEGGQARGIGVDERTSVLVEPDGSATVTGPGAAYFMEAPGLPQQCIPGYPLRFYDIPVTRVTEGSTFNLDSWRGEGTVSYTLSARDGHLFSSQAGGSPY